MPVLDNLESQLYPLFLEYHQSKLKELPPEQPFESLEEAFGNLDDDDDEAPDKATMRDFWRTLDGILSTPPDPDGVARILAEKDTIILASSWVQMIARMWKNMGALELSDCLVPKDWGRFKRVERNWGRSLRTLALPQKKAEDILRKFGETLDTFNLSGILIERTDDGFVVRVKERK